MSKEFPKNKKDPSLSKKLTQSCSHHKNLIIQRKNIIESFTVFHPMLDRLMEIKMAKCLQHGNIRSYKTHGTVLQNRANNNNIIQAPSIQGALKIYSLRPKTSMVKVNFRPSSRPKSTNTVIRSRTSQPRIQKKLELISKQATELDQQQMKPSIFITRTRKSNIESSPQIRLF